MRQQEKVFIISSLNRALQVYCGNTQCFHHSCDERHIHHTETMKISQSVLPHGCFPIFVHNPNKSILELCEAYRCHRIVNEEVIAACLTKHLLLEFYKCFTNANFVIVCIGSMCFSSPNNILGTNRQTTLTQESIY